MKQKVFFSELYKREIKPTEADYWAIVQAELLYRITDMKERDCSCMYCKENLKKFEKTLKSLRTQKSSKLN